MSYSVTQHHNPQEYNPQTHHRAKPQKLT